MANLPLMVRIVQVSPWSSSTKLYNFYRYGMLLLTFFCYMSYHMCRKPLSIVKGQLHRNCSKIKPGFENPGFGSHSVSQYYYGLPPEYFQELMASNQTHGDTWCDFAPFNGTDYKTMFGELDYAFLFTYAIGMFFSGIIAERLPLRYFLSTGMVLSGAFTAMFGLGYFGNIHAFWYYVVAQVLNGLMQTTGWPAVVTCVGNWFGKEKRGLIMGVWNSHTSVGNILGSVIASAFVGYCWGFSFVVPGIIIGAFGVVCFFTLIERPEDLGPKYQHLYGSNEDFNPSSNCHSDMEKPEYQAIVNEPDDNEEILTTVERIPSREHAAISFYGALCIPGVVEFSLCLFFAKLVSYTFLFWLPLYIKNTSTLDTEDSGLLSTLFDIGGIFGGILAGVVSDHTGGRASTCAVMLAIGAVMMYIFNAYGTASMAVSVILLLITGGFVNGPYALITTAVSADLGTHPTLQGNAKALSTVTAIIDGTGSIGAAIGPLLTGLISPSGWQNVFWMLIGSNVLALLLLTRLVTKEVKMWCNGFRTNSFTSEIYSDCEIEEEERLLENPDA